MTVECAPIARRGFLAGLAALMPVAVASAATPPVPAASPPPPENRRLPWLGEQLAALDLQLTAAVARKASARERALQRWPSPPAGIVWDKSRDIPDWCIARRESDIDGCDLFRDAERLPPRYVADAASLRDYVNNADRRTRAFKDARRALPLAEDYEAAREAVIASAGYGDARDDVRRLAYRIERVCDLIHRCPHRTIEGLAIKARAVLLITSRDAIDNHTAFRHKVLHGTTLARGIIGLAC